MSAYLEKPYYSRAEVIAILDNHENELAIARVRAASDRISNSVAEYLKDRAKQHESFLSTLGDVIKGKAPLSSLAAVAAPSKSVVVDTYVYMTLNPFQLRRTNNPDRVFKSENNIFLGLNINDAQVIEILSHGIVSRDPLKFVRKE